MNVSEVMTSEVKLCSPNDTIADAARHMADEDIGSLPIGENDRLVGMLTDRDIVIRAVAESRDASTRIRDVMTPQIEYCFEDDSVDAAAQKMGSLGVRRLPVLDRSKRLVGMLSLSNLQQAGAVDGALAGTATPHRN